ncbi:hypothetical protein GCM10009131_31500 [Morganella psychrotolerans]
MTGPVPLPSVTADGNHYKTTDHQTSGYNDGDIHFFPIGNCLCSITVNNIAEKSAFSYYAKNYFK